MSVTQNDTKPYAYHVERFQHGSRVHSMIVYETPDPAILENLRRHFEVRVTDLYTSSSKDAERYHFLRRLAFDPALVELLDSIDEEVEADTPEKYDVVVDAAIQRAKVLA